jgi:hypothetical protein
MPIATHCLLCVSSSCISKLCMYYVVCAPIKRNESSWSKQAAVVLLPLSPPSPPIKFSSSLCHLLPLHLSPCCPATSSRHSTGHPLLHLFVLILYLILHTSYSFSLHLVPSYFPPSLILNLHSPPSFHRHLILSFLLPPYPTSSSLPHLIIPTSPLFSLSCLRRYS